LLVGDLFGKPFKIGIRTPYINWTNLRKDKKGKYINEAFGLIEVSDLSVVTSGTYERYIRDRSGNEYHHILHPATGLPINNNVVSITVITEESIMADGYSTTLFALGMEKGLEIVENTEGLETIWVIRNGKTCQGNISFLGTGG
jgi:thiamine biosynthesis lipoprotein